MKHIAVIGTSHVGALKQAWTELENELEQYQFTFFAARSSMYRTAGTQFLTLSNGVLSPNSNQLVSAFAYTAEQPNGKIILADYDAFWIYGFSPRVTLDFTEGLSSDFREKIFAENVSKKNACYLVKMIRDGGFEGSVFVSPPPMRLIEQQPSIFTPHDGYMSYTKGYRSLLKRYNAQLVLQPEQSLTSGFCTMSDFGVGSEKLDVSGDGRIAHQQSDISHMNVQFGQAMITSFLSGYTIE